MNSYVSASGRQVSRLSSATDGPVISSTEPQPRIATCPHRTRSTTARFPNGPGWVVHVPVAVPDMGAALALAEQMATWLGSLPHVQAGAMEVSAEDEQSRRLLVFCDRRLDGLARCRLRHGHEGECRAIR